MLIFGILWMTSLFANANVEVHAELSRSHVPVGEMVQLDIKILGTEDADPPQNLSLDGLQINLMGQSKEMEMVNSVVNSSIRYSYIVIPLRSGIFTIPSIRVHADGKYFQTSPLQLTVEGSVSSPSSSMQSPQQPSSFINNPPPTSSTTKKIPTKDQIAFSELSVPKRKLYVGEVVPVEVRFYVDARYSARVRQLTNFNNEGLLVERLSDPLSSTEERHGTIYNVLTFHTFVSAVKTGMLHFGPVTLGLALELPVAPPADMPDLMAQLLGHSGAMSQEHSLTLKSNTISLEAIALPTEGRPEHFSGAIGDFQMDAIAQPKKYVPGDPITLALTIEGSGNFKAISMPELTNVDGWKIYPATDKIDPPDAAGLHGIKTFQVTMMTQEPKTSTPGSLFSYFNPNTGKYVTLSTPPQTLQVLTTAKTSTPSTATNSALEQTAKLPNPSPSPLINKNSMRSWKPLLYQHVYFQTTLILLGVFFLLAAYLSFQWYRKNAFSLKEQKLKEQWLELQEDQLSADLFLKKAVIYAEELLGAEAASTPELKEIFKRHDEINYGAREIILSSEERRKILGKLKSLHPLHES